MTLTTEQLQKVAINWSLVIKSIPGYEDMEFVPKGDSDSMETLLANWGQAPVGYPVPTEAQLLTGMAAVDILIDDALAVNTIAADAEAGWDSVPNWATWTAQEAADWIDVNVTDLPSAKVALSRMAMAIMWLADKTFPNRR